MLAAATAAIMGLTDARAQEELVDTLDASRISATREKVKNTTQTGLMHIESRQLTTGVAVLGSPDIIKKLQTLPGVAAGNELMSGLYVHGGDGNDNLFLLDGIPLYNISHFGGLFSSFNTDVIDNLDFYKSGFPARYGGRMSSVVDVETREGDMNKFHGGLSLGLIDGRVHLEGPIVKGKTSFNLGLRRSWLDVVAVPLIAYANRQNGDNRDVNGGYAMSDVNARITHRFSPTSTLNVVFYTGADDLRFSMDSKSEKSSSNMATAVKWGSLTGGASHEYKISRKLKFKNMLYYTQSTSDTGYNFRIGGTDSLTSMDDNDKSYVRELGLTSNWDWYPNAFNHVRFGLSARQHWYHTGREFLSFTESGGEKLRESGDRQSQSYTSFEPAVYAEDEFFLRYNITLNAGVRLALSASPGRIWPSIEPRLAFKWLITNNISAKLSYTRMSQFAHLVAAVYMDLPSNCWMPSTASARPMTSDQIAGGLYTQLGPVKLNVEGWYKTMDHILAYNGSNSFVPPITEWEKSFTEGKGRSCGLELEATYDKGPLSLSAYYTLSRTVRYFDEVYFDWYPDRNDNRHKINLVASWRFARHWELFASWNYHSGNRITFPSHYIEADGKRTLLYDSPYNTPLPDYHRLDAGLDFSATFKNGNTLKVNLSVYNAYNKANASMAFLESDADGNYRGMAYGLIPIIPTITVSYKF